MPDTTTAQMGEQHEIHLAKINGGRKSKSSGNQWDDPGDGRNARDDAFSFCWDGKSTKGKSITVTLAMIEKIREQAGGERPEIGLRWYATGDLSEVAEDWIAIRDVDFEEMKIAATAYELARPRIEGALAALEELGSQNERLTAELTAAMGEVERLKQGAPGEPADEGRAIPGFVPCLPWTVVYTAKRPGAYPYEASLKSGVRYEADGRMMPFEVSTVRVERGPGNRPRLFVDDALVRHGDLYVEGTLQARVCEDRSVPEIG